MKLNLEQIQALTLGAAETVIQEGGIQFYRMPETTARQIWQRNHDFGMKALATAGIRMDFSTDSEFFAFSYDCAKAASSRSWYYFTLLIDGKPFAEIGEEKAERFCGEYQTRLPKGNKRITLFFPNLFRARICGVELSDGAGFERIAVKKRFVFYGDSITQGYDAKSAAKGYVNRIAYAADAEIFNFGIGGAVFDKDMLDTSNDYNADGVFVAYGTNDWGYRESLHELSKYCEEVFAMLSSLFANKPVFVLLPIWRVNYQEIKQTGALKEVRACIAQIAKRYENFRVIDLEGDIPQDEAFFSDGLHPNDEGFAYFAQGVLKKINL